MIGDVLLVISVSKMKKQRNKIKYKDLKTWTETKLHSDLTNDDLVAIWRLWQIYSWYRLTDGKNILILAAAIVEGRKKSTRVFGSIARVVSIFEDNFSFLLRNFRQYAI